MYTIIWWMKYVEAKHFSYFRIAYKGQFYIDILYID